MATVTGITAQRMQEIIDKYVVSGHVNEMGSLILVTTDGTEIDAGAVMDPLLPGTTAQYYRGDKTWQTLNKAAVGLPNADNTSDANKPVSNAQKILFVAKWKPSTVYAIGDQVVTPNNEVVTAMEAHTSAASYDYTKWSGRPFGHLGKTSGFQTVSAAGNVVTMDTPQILRGGMVFDTNTDSLIVPKSGLYIIRTKPYLVGSQGYLGSGKVQRNAADITGTYTSTWKGDPSDYTWSHEVTRSLTAGDSLNMIVAGSNSLGSTWGTDGFNGSYFEVEFSAS